MGLYIPNMKMPIDCAECIVPLSKCDYLQCRADRCTLIEIHTPHGRLIEEHYSGELQAKQPEGLFVMYRSADKDTDRFILEAEK